MTVSRSKLAGDENAGYALGHVVRSFRANSC
jgi:hypothetical protein